VVTSIVGAVCVARALRRRVLCACGILAAGARGCNNERTTAQARSEKRRGGTSWCRHRILSVIHYVDRTVHCSSWWCVAPCAFVIEMMRPRAS